MTYSPPQQAEHIRHQQLTPESPRPQQLPSPANIPILSLDKQMDPVFAESAYNSQHATPAPQYPSAASHTLNPPASTASQYADQSHMSGFQDVGAQSQSQSQSAGSGAPTGGPSSAYGAVGTQSQDTSSIQNYAAPHHTATHDAHTQNHPAHPLAHNNAFPAQPAPVQSAPGAYYQTEAAAVSNSNVDVQALLDSLTPSANHAPSGNYASQFSAQSAQGSASASASLPQPASNLPPRPPAQEKPVTHPNYDPSDDIRSYHPGSQMPSNTQQRSGQPQTTGVGGQQASAGGAHMSLAPGAGQAQLQRSSSPGDDEDIRWGPETNRLYEAFLDQERKFVTEGQWDQFPMGSRLFIGNLPTEKVTKRDIFHRFYRHGRLAQISIKQAYGFVQFLDAESCRRALDTEQGQAVRGRKMHLEISKPQRNTKKAEPPANNGVRRRSRSPDYNRGGTGPARDGRYGGPQNSMSPRDRDRRFRDRDDYRPMRSPSPRGPSRGIRSRDRSRDRSPSPRRDPDDDLALPRRAPHEVPDIQVLVLNESIPRDFVRYVEDTFRQQNLRINVLIMSPRLPEAAVVRRQIIEGVLAIVRLDTGSLTKGKVNVQVFDRRGGAGNIQFNEYADLDLITAAMLINNAKQTAQAAQPPAPAYGYNPPMPQYPPPTANPFQAAQAAQPNISNIIGSLDPNTITQLLGAMSQQNNVAQNAQPAPAINTDLARLLAQVSSSSPTHTPGFSTPAQSHLPQVGQAQYSALAAMLGGQSQASAPPVQPPAQQPAGAPDMNEIMAQLAKYQR
ncbi:hypothetical protein E8E13_010277 [Curvularia kusanoi]|uniref:RRM domain-containing protein n=1 Tax=Curvularia kusanoi TaxID=90978 RepID=A0A9P4W8D4_CURKU|nr:hypothetical protein E8E13_010277 [Curvularia kusanoi]